MTTDQADEAAAIARDLVERADIATLATVDADGAPFASLVTIATTARGEPLLLLSTLAVHTRNLLRGSRASLLFTAPPKPGEDPLTNARLTVTGAVRADPDPAVRARFLARHPEAAGYADFGDFAFYRVVLGAGHLVAGFGKIVTLSSDDLLKDPK